jgi:hypothetical protein
MEVGIGVGVGSASPPPPPDEPSVQAPRPRMTLANKAYEIRVNKRFRIIKLTPPEKWGSTLTSYDITESHS